MRRAPVAAALAALLALAPALVLPVLAARAPATFAAPAAAAAPTPPKVVIVVGATEGTTASYRADADNIAAEALKYTPNVVKLYSPNATWAMVKAAAQGASIFVYLGHGYGFPSPYRPILSPTVQNGMGLNEIGGVDDNDKKYYGESLIASDIRFAKNAVVLLNHLCYSAGSSESGHPEPTIPVAKQRVDNFASGFIKAGARAVIAQSWTSGVIYTIKSIFTTNQTIGNMWNNAPNKQGHVIPFIPQRNPQYEGRLDPDTWTTGFHRSIVGALGMSTTDVVSGAGVPFTTGAPDTTSPELWSIDGPRTITPNFDGNADWLRLLARYSESVNWTATLENANADVVKTLTGSGHQPAITWDVKAGGALVPEGQYTWKLSATDGAGNAAPPSSGLFTVQAAATPDTGVLELKPTTPTLTNGSTVTYSLKFAGPVTGLAAADFTRTGTAADCVVGAPTGSGAVYTLTLTACATGSVGLYLNSGTVTDAAMNAGPAGPITTSATVTIDRTAPKAVAPKASIPNGAALSSASSTAGFAATVSWTASDTGGAGIASYDLARSYDGGAFTVLATGLTGTSVGVLLNPGHSYRYQVRARDKAGNLGAWAAASTWYPSLTQQTTSAVTYTGTWGTASTTSYSGGSTKYATGANASASFTFSGRAIAWVTTTRPEGGEVKVYVDGALVSTVDTGADPKFRVVGFSTSWASYGSHTIKLVVVGTAGRPRVDLDAFEIVR